MCQVNMFSVVSKLKGLISSSFEEEVSDQDIREHLKNNAQKGDLDCQCDYAIVCLDGFGGPVNLGHGEYWLNLAANEGHSNAQYFLGYCYFEGKYLDKDAEKGNFWLTIAASNGHEEAQKYVDTDT
jgi:TPR repeat protein